MTHGRQQRGLFAAIDFKQPAKELDRLKGTFDGWVKHQPPAMEVALVTAAGGAQGAFLGGVMGVMTAMDPSGAGKLLSQPPPGSNPQASPAPTPPSPPPLPPPIRPPVRNAREVVPGMKITCLTDKFNMNWGREVTLPGP